MTSSLDAIAGQSALRRRLLALLQAGDLDSALQAGLMEYATTSDDEDVPIREAQAKLRTAWDARERYRARETRLARRAAERAARRSAAAQPAIDGEPSVADAPAVGVPATETPARPALPAAAAAALARARARAAGKA